MITLTIQSQMHAFLRGVSYPAPKPNLIGIAEGNGATHELIATLRELPEGNYFCLPDVIQELEELDPPAETEEDRSTYNRFPVVSPHASAMHVHTLVV